MLLIFLEAFKKEVERKQEFQVCRLVICFCVFKLLFIGVI